MDNQKIKTQHLTRVTLAHFVTLCAAVLLSACPLATKSAISVKTSAIANSTITSISPENPVEGDRVILTGERFPSSSNIKAGVVLSDGSMIKVDMEVANSESASVVMPAMGNLRLAKMQILRGTTVIASYDVTTSTENNTSPAPSAPETIATPTFSVAAGAYGPTQTVTFSSATETVTFYSTVNGVDPTCAHILTEVAGSSISVAVSATVKVIACKTGYSDSAVASATYTINGAVATPVATVTSGDFSNGTYSNNVSVTLSTVPIAATIYYTVNGADPTTSSTPYNGTITISGTTTLKAIAVIRNYSNSAVMSQSYTLTAATPTFSVAAGAYGPTQTVTFSSATETVTFYSTINGVDPRCDHALTEVAGDSISVAATKTVKVIACKTGYTDSLVASAAYDINGTIATPTFSPAAGSYGPMQTVIFISTTQGVTFYSTINGVDPTCNHALTEVAGDSISVAVSETVKVIACKTGYTDSLVASAAYVINGTVATPTFSPVADAYGPAQSVTIGSLTSGVTIYYTIDGSTPTTLSTQYSGAIAVASNQTLQAIAVKPAYQNSVMGTAAYTITDGVPPSGYSISFTTSPVNDSNAAAATLSIESAEVGATYIYTITSSGGVYTISATGTIATSSQSITGINVSSLRNGTLTASLTLTDPIGNVGAATTATVSKSATCETGIGVVCADGSIYAGMSPDGNVPMYLAQCDIGQTWGGSSCTGSVTTKAWGPYNVTAGVANSVTGKANTVTTASLGTTYAASTACQNLVAHGKSDWFLPALDQLTQIFTNRSPLGMPSTSTWYWTSTEWSSIPSQNVKAIRFSDGFPSQPMKTMTYNVRCIRASDNTAPTGYAVAVVTDPIDQNNFSAVSIQITGAERYATFNYTITSDAGGTPVTGTGTIATTTQTVSNINVGSLNDGNVTVSLTLTDETGNIGGSVSDSVVASGIPCSVTVGKVCADGSVFAGLTPDGNVPMYTTRCSVGQTWNGSACTGTQSAMTWNDGTYGYLDTALPNCATNAPSGTGTCSTGKSNSELLLSEDSSTTAGFQPHTAVVACDNLADHGHSDWYLPSINELYVVYVNQSAIGNISPHSIYRYLSSSELSAGTAKVILFSDGSQAAGNNKNNYSYVRCVRKE